MTALPSPHADFVADPTAFGTAALLAGPCALPSAPLAMPPQVIEAEHGLLWRLVHSLIPARPATPSAGAGL